MKLIRIAHVNEVAAVGSVLEKELIRRGFDAKLFQPTVFGATLPSWFRLVTFPFRMIGILVSIFKIYLWRPDILHIHNGRHAFIGYLVGVPYVVHFHGSEVRNTEPNSWWGKKLINWCDKADHVFFSTPDLMEPVQKFCKDATYLPNPIDLSLFTPPKSIDRSVDVLIAVQMSEIKGAAKVTEVVRHILEIRPETSFTVVSHGEFWKEVLEIIGPKGKVVERQNRKDLALLMWQHRTAIGQMKLGAIGNFELECLSAGLLVGMHLVWEPTSQELTPVVGKASAREVALNICWYLEHEIDREEFTTMSREWVQSLHASEKIVENVVAVYEEILG